MILDTAGIDTIPADTSNRSRREGSSASKTVLFVTRTPGYGGTEKHLIDLVQRLRGSDVRSLILCADADPYTQRLHTSDTANVTIHVEKGLLSLWDWYRALRKFRADIAVLVYGTLTAIPPCVSVAARMAGIRELYAIQHLIPPPLQSKLEGRWFRNLGHRLIGGRARIAAHLCDTTICVSDAVRNALVKQYRFPPRKTITIRNGVSLSDFTPDRSSREAVRDAFGIRSDEVLLVCSARLSIEKGLDVLLAAIRGLVRKGIKCRCLILGEGQLRPALEKQIQTMELTRHVWLHGFHPDVRPYLNAADIFVLTSYAEGLPLAVLEAMACGLPCVVTDAGGSAEAVTHNVQGLVVPPGSTEEVEAALSYLVANPAERARMSRAARAKASEQFDLECQMADLRTVILGGGHIR